jgi:hypothetical protein
MPKNFSRCSEFPDAGLLNHKQFSLSSVANVFIDKPPRMACNFLEDSVSALIQEIA